MPAVKYLCSSHQRINIFEKTFFVCCMKMAGVVGGLVQTAVGIAAGSLPEKASHG